MPRITLTERKLSDLIFHEANSPYVGYDRADLDRATVTVTGSDVLTLGTPVFRAKGADSTDIKWAPVKLTADIATTNEYALVIADGLGEQLDVSGAGDHNVTLLVRGPVMVKDAQVKKAATAIGLTDAVDQEDLMHLLRAQGILPEITIA